LREDGASQVPNQAFNADSLQWGICFANFTPHCKPLRRQCGSVLPVNLALCAVGAMKKVARAIVWTYLLVFCALVAVQFAVEAFIGNFYSGALLMFLPAAVVYRYMCEQKTPLVFVLLSPFSIIGPFLDASMFKAVAGATYGMYFWFGPMLLLVACIAVRKIVVRSGT